MEEEDLPEPWCSANRLATFLLVEIMSPIPLFIYHLLDNEARCLDYQKTAPERGGLSYILISISTPAGRLRFVRASITFGLGVRISMILLCVRISYCSRESLCTNAERFTVYFLISVGKGTGPTASHPYRSTVSMICFEEASITLWS